MSGWVGGHLCQGGSSGFHINTRPLHGIYLGGRGASKNRPRWLQAWYLEAGPPRLPLTPCQGHPEASPSGLVFPKSTTRL